MDLGWNVWAERNRILKKEYKSDGGGAFDQHLMQTGQWKQEKTPPSGGSGVTQNTSTPVGNITFEHIIDYGQYYRAAPELPHQPVQYFIPICQELKVEPGWKDRVDELEEQVLNLKDWCQELLGEIEDLKRNKLDKFNSEVLLL